MLRAGRSLSWRCRTLDETEIGVFVKGCSKSTGTAVITCTTSSTRLTCENTLGPGGFWVTRSSFYLL